MNTPNETPLSLADLLDRVNGSSISTIGSVVARIIAVINNPDATAKELVDIILTDPPLAANVLRLVNSAYCAPRNKIADIQQAVIFIGFETLKELALNQKVCEIFRRGAKINGYSRARLWKHSVAVAVFSKMIYRREFVQRGENAYAVGLLHDLGIIIEDQFQNETLIQAIETASNSDIPLVQAEQETFGYNHAQVGMALAENWHLPDEIASGIGYHHHPGQIPEAVMPLAHVLHIANSCCQKNNIGYCDAPQQDEDQLNQCMHALDLEPHALDLIMQEVHQKLADMEAEGIL